MSYRSMFKTLLDRAGTGLLIIGSFVIGGIITRMDNPLKVLSTGLGLITLMIGLVSGVILPEDNHDVTVRPLAIQDVATPTETLPPNTPLVRETPTRTLLPPPTFEPPTPTSAASNTPAPTATVSNLTTVNVPGLNGLETATPSTTPGCEPREDWKLVYEVQPNDSLEAIGDRYGVYTADLAAGNCISDVNVIVVGQRLRVPGDAHPNVPAVECVPWEVMTPFDGAYGINGAEQITFNWRGPRAPRNLIRIFRPDGTFWERTIDLRQNETIKLSEILPAEGTYQWQVYPLDLSFRQVACKESPLWTFHKTLSPTPTPTPDPNAGGNNNAPLSGGGS